MIPKTPRISRPKSLLACYPISGSDRSCRQSKRRRQEGAGASQKCLQTATICGSKTSLPEVAPSFLIVPNEFFFQEFSWLLSELCKLWHPPTNCCETSARVVWETLLFLPCSIWPARGCKHPQTMLSAPFLHPTQDFMHSYLLSLPPVIYFQG